MRRSSRGDTVATRPQNKKAAPKGGSQKPHESEAYLVAGTRNRRLHRLAALVISLVL